MYDKKVKIHGKRIIEFLSKMAARRDANTCCPFFGYQPKLPDSVKNLKKYYGLEKGGTNLCKKI